MSSLHNTADEGSAVSDGPCVQKAIAITLLIFVAAIASELPTLFDELFALEAPSFLEVAPPFAVFYAPILVMIIWFNCIAKGHGRFVMTIDAALVSGALLVSTLTVMECLHALDGGTPDLEIVLGIAWMIALLFTLRSFDYLEGWANVMLVAAAVFCSIISIAGVVIPVNGLADLGIQLIFQRDRPEWSGVNSHAYFAAAITTIALHRLLFDKSAGQWRIFWISIAVVNLLAILGNKSRGAWMSVILASFMLVMSRSTGWSNRKVAVATAALGGVMLLLVMNIATIDYVVSLGRGLLPEQEFSGRLESIDRSTLSVRTRMAEEAGELVAQSPIVGHGWATVSELSFSGHSMHGVPQIIAASYGFIGLSLLAIFLYFNFRGVFTSPVVLPLLLILCVETTVRPDIPLWFAIIIAFLVSSRSHLTFQAK